MCIDYRKLNKATKKDHSLLPFIDEMLERLVSGFSTTGSKFVSVVRRARMVSTGDNEIYTSSCL
jgi:hypothetical protein